MSAYKADDAKDLFVDGPSARFVYRRVGPRGGAPLVLVNRFRGTLDWWDPEFVEYLAADRDIILFDNVGIGYSTGTPRDTVEGMADSAIEFLDKLGLENVDLLGWSLGGMVAQHVALKRPALVRKLVVAGSTAGGEVPGAPPPTEKALAIMMKPEATVDDVVTLLFPETDEARKLGYAHIARVSKRFATGKPTISTEATVAGVTAIGKVAALPLEQAQANLAALKCPVLFATGAKDWLVPAVASFFAVEHVGSQSVLLVYSDAGHAFLFQHTKTFTDQVKAFLAA
jgi:pimeloyl-ACP methyl ester carboxylesterase